MMLFSLLDSLRKLLGLRRPHNNILDWDTTSNNQPQHYEASHEKPLRLLFTVLIMGLIIIILYSATINWDRTLEIAGYGVMLAFASVSIGGLLGFVFGVPSQPSSVVENQTSNPAGKRLQEFFDWFVKIFVGVGLTEITALPDAFRSAGNYVMPALGNKPSSGPFAIAIMLTYGICGFLIGYLWTVFTMSSIFDKLDMARLREEIKEQATQVTEQLSDKIDKQTVLTAELNALVNWQLNPLGGEEDKVKLEGLIFLLKSAPPSTRSAILTQARDKRREGLFNPATRKGIENTILVYQALIQTAPTEDHYLYAELGFALKDQSNPDWVEAEKMLTEAIRIRGDWKVGKWASYEANRAICYINHYGKDTVAGAEVRQAILEDLRAAKACKMEWLFSEDTSLAKDHESRYIYKDVAAWMTVNHVTDQDLVTP